MAAELLSEGLQIRHAQRAARKLSNHRIGSECNTLTHTQIVFMFVYIL